MMRAASTRKLRNLAWNESGLWADRVRLLMEIFKPGKPGKGRSDAPAKYLPTNIGKSRNLLEKASI